MKPFTAAAYKLDSIMICLTHKFNVIEIITLIN